MKYCTNILRYADDTTSKAKILKRLRNPTIKT